MTYHALSTNETLFMCYANCKPIIKTLDNIGNNWYTIHIIGKVVFNISKRKYVVYLHVNKINGKKYVGLTSQLPKVRWQNGRGYNHCPYFHNAIKKHGWDNFEHYILNYDLTMEEAEKLEKHFINKWSLTDKQYGYNMTGGGGINPPDKIETGRSKYFTINGVTKNITGWAKEYHISPTTIRKRMGEGLTMEEALNKPSGRYKHITYQGQTKPLSEWCRIFDLNYGTTYDRIFLHNIPLDEAFQHGDRRYLEFKKRWK